jgi:hypothetical protein
MVVPLLCESFKQRNKRHIINIPVSAKRIFGLRRPWYQFGI